MSQPLAPMLEQLPLLQADWQAFVGLFDEKNLIEPRLRALLHHRIAQCHRCAPLAEMSGELARDDIDALPNYGRDLRFSETEKACLELAELFLQDPNAIDDDLARKVVASLGDATFVALLQWLAISDGFCRFQILRNAA